ncbi:MAG TPA: R3H domain-containing nucleic acid-binding protein [Acidobacteriota bacterium]|nr:R3H domain-containing nucleic acid-binding protein [Acidobacteriota bacterium]
MELNPTSAISQANGQRAVRTDDLGLLLNILPHSLRTAVEKLDAEELLEVILDVGRRPQARVISGTVTLLQRDVTFEDIQAVVARTGEFSGDNRAGIERTLHRISAMRNRKGQIIGLTCRVGRAVTGTLDIVRDVIESGKSLLLLGPPGVGKTTLLREAARVLADQVGKRVMVVDTSNEIAGDGDVPHPGIGGARRMQVPSPQHQHQVMIEAVENHMPEVIVIDEIGTLEEALAARTIAERGVQLVATAHGLKLENLVQNPTLCDLVGGIQAVTLGDDEARRRGTQKTVLERKAPPTFASLVEIQSRQRLAVFHEIAPVVDALLQGRPLKPEVRERCQEGGFRVNHEPAPSRPTPFESAHRSNGHVPASSRRRIVKLFPIGVNRGRLQRAVRELRVPVRIADHPGEAHMVVSLKNQAKRRHHKLKSTLRRGVSFHILKSNTYSQIKNFLRDHFLTFEDREAGIQDEIAGGLREVEDAVARVRGESEIVELPPRKAYVRRKQHEQVQVYGLYSESQGEASERHVVIYPREIARNFQVT